MPISCHFQDCKALLVLSPSRVRRAIASTGLNLLPFYHCMSGEKDKKDNFKALGMQATQMRI